MNFKKCNTVYLSNSDVNYLAISCIDKKAELTIKTWLLERNIVFEEKFLYYIVIPYGMAAVNMTAFDLTKEIAMLTKVESEMLIVDFPLASSTPIEQRHIGINSKPRLWEVGEFQSMKKPYRSNSAASVHLGISHKIRDAQVVDYIIMQFLIMKNLYDATSILSNSKLQLLVWQQFQLP
jgi:hypothetical protein